MHLVASRRVATEESAGKVMLIAFFNCKGMIYQHYFLRAPWGDKDYYILVSINIASASEENV